MKDQTKGLLGVRNNKILDAVDLDTPAWERDTTGMWVDVPPSILSLFEDKGIHPAEAIHAAQHAFLNRFPLAEDVRTECKAAEKEYKKEDSGRKRPARYVFSAFFCCAHTFKFDRLIIYDPTTNVTGIAAKAFDNGETISLLFFHVLTA